MGTDVSRVASGVSRPSRNPLRLTPHAPHLTSQAGFTMVGVVLAMILLAIAIAAVAPAVGKIGQRDREYELIFRGRQYARAIALFQRRFGRYPNTLKELYEAQPRSIRKLWKDPICNCADWQVLILNTPDANPSGGGPGMTGAGPTPTPSPPPSAFFPGGGAPIGPIVGVRSKVHRESLLEWRGKKNYDEWRFIVGDADRDNTIDPLGLGGRR
jgi:type II secretory pathway pseudopilin PulG